LHVFIAISFKLFVFHELVQFRDAEIQPLYVFYYGVSVNHLPGEHLYQPDALEAADKNSGKHYLVLDLVGFEELDAAVCGAGNEDDGPEPYKSHDRNHFPVIKFMYHRPDEVAV
jgi:hypothetical protein